MRASAVFFMLILVGFCGAGNAARAENRTVANSAAINNAPAWRIIRQKPARPSMRSA